jgi:mRNA-decapping enzyme subunit 2
MRRWTSKSWTFPAGKINQGEEGIDAAARETWEETGFDPNGKYGLTADMKATWQQPLQEKDAVSYTEDGGKHRTCFICHGVPEDFPFAPVARKEVASVAWHPIEKVPKKNFALLPLLPKVKRWIKRSAQKTPKRGTDKSTNNKANDRQGTPNKSNTRRGETNTSTPLKSNKTPNRKDKQGNNKTPNRDRKKQASRSRSRGKSVASEDLVESGLAMEGGEGRWSEEDMFQVNERLMGRKVEYDGNPHVFSEQGFQGKDPHSIHVVGGGFMNSNSQELAPAPHTSKLQHLFRTGSAGGDAEDSEILTPFFSDDGATPWGEVVKEVKETVSTPQRQMMIQSKTVVKGNNNKSKQTKKQQEHRSIMATGDNDADLVFMTDYEITQKSQKEKMAQLSSHGQYEQDVKDIAAWVENLPNPAPSKHFGEFRFNVDALMESLSQHY